MIRTKIIGTGSYLPERVVSNREVGALLGLEPAVVSRLTGIQERRRAAASQASSDLAVEAARPALEAAGLPVSELGAIVLSTTSPDTVFPATACHVQRGWLSPDTSIRRGAPVGLIYGLGGDVDSERAAQDGLVVAASESRP